MPINKEKGAAYLRYRRALANATYAKINEETKIPTATLSAYFNGTVQSPNKETYEKLMAAVGGSWEEYDDWSPESAAEPAKVAAVLDPEVIERIVASLRQSFDAVSGHGVQAHAAEIKRIEAAHERELERIQSENAAAHRAQKIEKYVLFALLVAALAALVVLVAR